MNPAKTSFPGVAAACVCAALLTGCDSIKDVRDEPFTALPVQTTVLQGTITGLGARRPVELQNRDGNGVVSARKFYGTFGSTTSPFSFDAMPAGASYEVTVKTQPYGKTCAVSNGTGVVGAAGAAAITVSCQNNTALARYTVTVNTAAVSALPNLKVSITTEEGVQEVNATGLSSVSFPNAIFNSTTSLPAFEYRVAATTGTPAPDGTTTANYCTFATGGAVTLGGQNLDATLQPVIPNGPATVTVNACSFTVNGTVVYNPPPGGTAQALGSGLQLALRNHFTGVEEEVVAVGALGAFAFTTPLYSNARSIHDLVVKQQPQGQYCVVSGATSSVFTTIHTAAGAALSVASGSAILLVDPATPEWWAFANRVVTCRAVPASNQLAGLYQRDDRVAPTATAPNPQRPREFLAFFTDGSFLYGSNWSAANAAAIEGIQPLGTASQGNPYAASGVQHGFYSYNAAAGTITFTVLTASNTNPSGRSLTGMPGTTPTTAAAGTATTVRTVVATSVVKTPGDPGRLSFRFSGLPPQTAPGGAAGTTTSAQVWNLIEPPSIAGELTGAWVTPDHRRMFIWNNNQMYGLHAGVNGLPTLQDACFLVVTGYTDSAGLLARHGGSAVDANGAATCTPGGTQRVPDLPFNTTTGTMRTLPRVPPGYNGRLPGSGQQYDLRPTSPISFAVTPGAAGAPDTLSVQETLNGTPSGAPVVFQRYRAN
jgi:hypothetical protein